MITFGRVNWAIRIGMSAAFIVALIVLLTKKNKKK